MKKKILFICFLLGYFSFIFAVNIGYVLYDYKNDSIVLQKNAKQAFSYASNVKLFTTYVILKHFKASYKFETKFAYKDNILYIKAGGDPFIVEEKLFLISKSLKNMGVDKINKIVLDNFLFEKKELLWRGNSSDNSYLPIISPLSLNFNTASIKIIPTKINEKPKVIISTFSDYYLIENKAKTVFGKSSNLQVSSRKLANKTKIIVKGSIGLNSKEKQFYKKIYHPEIHFLTILLNYFDVEEGKIIFEKREIPEDFFLREDIFSYTYSSPNIRELVRKMNLYSSNFMAEMFCAYLSAKNMEKDGLDFIRNYIKKSLQEDIIISDANGLGKSRIKPISIIKLFKTIKEEKFLEIDFLATLPEYGKEGTLNSSLLKERSSVAFAKTGTLNKVASISGIMKTRKDNYYFFTFVGNNLGKNVNKTIFRDKFIKKIWEEY